MHDSTQAKNLLDSIMHKDSYIVGDRAYDSDEIISYIEQKEAIAVIPPRKNRNQIERFFNRLKQFRRIATRYDKLLFSFLSLVELAVVFITIPKFPSIV